MQIAKLTPCCESCGEYHHPDTMCPPHEVRSKGRCVTHHHACDCREANYRFVAKALLKSHEPKCLFPGGDPTCLWDEGEVCSIHMSGKSGCTWWQVCECEACKVARSLFA